MTEPLDTMTDELAGRVIEAWHKQHPIAIQILPEGAYLDLRQHILTGIRDAVDQDRQRRLDCEEADRERRQREQGFVDWWG